eukprot:TRINITY_DN3842_c0_g1_i2.p1 TRINITY_DN3842_c0_g1~~TRINITY_DN3842_c0_g1_i2.p1  ORF type:complete len:201 (-),score=39.52 TRINITY_DN3842_c0_g1_i2:18-620(-)
MQEALASKEREEDNHQHFPETLVRAFQPTSTQPVTQSATQPTTQPATQPITPPVTQTQQKQTTTSKLPVSVASQPSELNKKQEKPVGTPNHTSTPTKKQGPRLYLAWAVLSVLLLFLGPQEVSTFISPFFLVLAFHGLVTFWTSGYSSSPPETNSSIWWITTALAAYNYFRTLFQHICLVLFLVTFLGIGRQGVEVLIAQ